MLHIFVVRSRNWHGCERFIQSLFFFSRYSHFSLKSFGLMPRCADILLISAVVYVGLITLQQLAQLRQFISCHTFFSASSIRLSRLAGGLLSILVIKYLYDFRRRSKCFFNLFRWIEFIKRY